MKFGIKYRETYEDYYVIEDPAIHTAEEAEAELIERIGNGTENGPEQCVSSSCETKCLEDIYLLIQASDGSILADRHLTFAAAQEAMNKAYKELTPEEWDESFQDMSYLGKSDAVLYNNGEEVYTWSNETITTD